MNHVERDAVLGNRCAAFAARRIVPTRSRTCQWRCRHDEPSRVSLIDLPVTEETLSSVCIGRLRGTSLIWNAVRILQRHVLLQLMDGRRYPNFQDTGFHFVHRALRIPLAIQRGGLIGPGLCKSRHTTPACGVSEVVAVKWRIPDRNLKSRVDQARGVRVMVLTCSSCQKVVGGCSSSSYRRRKRAMSRYQAVQAWGEVSLTAGNRCMAGVNPDPGALPAEARSMAGESG